MKSFNAHLASELDNLIFILSFTPIIIQIMYIKE